LGLEILVVLVLIKGKVFEFDELVKLAVVDGVARGLVAGVADGFVGFGEGVVFLGPMGLLILVHEQHNKALFLILRHTVLIKYKSVLLSNIPDEEKLKFAGFRF
jgi:hypothetical protein